jgi:Uma2 family endonuclease
MNHELDDAPGVVTPGAEPLTTDEVARPVYENRKGCELIEGVWVPKERPYPPPPERKGFELIDGKWVEKPMSNIAGIVEAAVAALVYAHVRAGRLGIVLGPDAAYRLFGETSTRTRKPDASFVAAGRITPSRDQDGYWPIAPDLAVEVTSPNDGAEDLEEKLDEYLRAGVRLVWVIYLPTRNVWAYKPDGTARLYRTGDTLPGEDVLPGFTVPVAELFEGV